MLANQTVHNDAAATGGTENVAANTVQFPSLAWFERLAELMNEQRSFHEKLGYMDCKVRFVVTDGHGAPYGVDIEFEEFGVVMVRKAGAGLGEAGPGGYGGTESDGSGWVPDFTMEASLATWRGMIESIAAGGGKPDLQQTLNDLNMRRHELVVNASDSLNRHLFFRYNQSLQAFVNASAAFVTTFPAMQSGAE